MENAKLPESDKDGEEDYLVSLKKEKELAASTKAKRKSVKKEKRSNAEILHDMQDMQVKMFQEAEKRNEMRDARQEKFLKDLIAEQRKADAEEKEKDRMFFLKLAEMFNQK